MWHIYKHGTKDLPPMFMVHFFMVSLDDERHIFCCDFVNKIVLYVT